MLLSIKTQSYVILVKGVHSLYPAPSPPPRNYHHLPLHAMSNLPATKRQRTTSGSPTKVAPVLLAYADLVSGKDLSSEIAVAFGPEVRTFRHTMLGTVSA